MGGKRTGARGLLYFCVAGLIILAAHGCASIENTRIEIKERVEAYQSLHRGRKLLAQGDYEGASYENLKILSLATHRPPEDEALFNLGWICAHPGNPEKDYDKSIFFFKKLLKNFPQSSWSERAKIWVDLLEENAKITREKEKLTGTVEGLNRMMEEQKKIDKMVQEWEQAREQPFSVSDRLLAEGNYEGALKEDQRIFSLSGLNPPGDEALYRMGVIHAHPGNSKRDTTKSLALFRRLIKDYPTSPWVEQAKTWAGVLQENEKLSRSVEELSLVIEKSKQVDIEIEERKRGKAR
ncbi:MAG TPA: tetratricopeptide repeat protein [Thermodesulfobacteriota bacterium]|nr:tetratricopeptide repeat protein [Thermodesulfobacteriota bacterium]